ncbi:MAG: hypothetical protein M3Z25_17355, partial [Actinomycetota bacterium]|nr:hypothetical protein [Actinomycetota bacterium]
DPVSLKPAIDAGADTIYVLAVSASYPPPDHHSARAVLRHSLTILLFPRIRLDAIGLPDGQDSLRIIKIPSGSAQVSLMDMSRHAELIEQGHRETARFLADQGSGSLDRDASHTAIMPELTVDAERHKEVTSETRTAADPRTQS